MREVIATGKTVEEATEKGCAELGHSRDDVSVEILEMPVKKLFKTLPAKVRVTVDEEEEMDLSTIEKPAPATQQESKKEVPKAKKIEEAPKKQPAAKGRVLPSEPEVEIDLAATPHVNAAVDYLLEIFRAMGAQQVQVKAFKQGEATLFRVEGINFAEIFEVRGDSIQALSYLVDRAVNKNVDKHANEYLHVRLDIAGYRNRRETELIALAKRAGEEVSRTHRSRTLAPMNSYERLIIHTAIGEMEGLISESIGSDVERRVVIKSTADDATAGDDWKPARGGNGRPPRRDNRGGRGNGRRNRNDGDRRGGGRKDFRGGEKASSTPEREYADQPRDTSTGPVVPKQRDAIDDGGELPLYGKIEL
ncbi:Jag N-terminal domain-containing protein [Ruminococcaceae bacterium OttesenSCG-928-A16]|nr:Jag N-terminal domain-containing protein [Ruminococcaceae bacterium OttesenSCG-928-A16]